MQKGDIAVIETNLGTIKFEFLLDVAPNHVANFEKLADAGFYDGTRFHRVIPGFMIQGGDPNSRGADRSIMGTGDPGWTVKAEFNDTPFERGIVGMARANDPNSAGSQFFIMVAPARALDHQYTAFGKVTEGMDVVDKIVDLPRDGRDNPKEENPAIVKSVKIIHPTPKKA
ncbi:MAG: peptidylprolyl isomerase [Fimbriimonadaceae bacterium]